MIMIVDDLYSHDVFGWGGGFNLDGIDSTPDPSDPPKLSFRANNVAFSDMEVSGNMFEVNGHSYDIDLENISFSDINSVSSLSPCGFTNMIWQGAQHEFPVAKLQFSNFSVVDSSALFIFYRQSSGVYDRSSLRTIFKNGEFLRNTVCEQVLVPWAGTTRVQNVDFGEGADANIGDDFDGACAPSDLGNNITFGQYQTWELTPRGSYTSTTTCWP
jgi:hypothetical protein